MTSHIRLYSDPTALACSLAITGEIEPFRVGMTYVGHLVVAGQHGDVTIEHWEGDNLPGGMEITFDADHSQLVLTWPTAEEIPAHEVTVDAANRSFEDGDTGWDKAEGITITDIDLDPPSSPGSTYSAQYRNSQGLAEIVNQTFVPLTRPGQTIHASVNVQQGASAAGHTGGAVRLKWYDRNYLYLGEDTGEWIRSGSRGAWHRSNLTVDAPARTGYMKLAGVFDRTKKNLPMWLDDFTWDGAFTYMADASKIGHDNEDPIHLSITIRDARGCRATWSGVIRDYAVYLTSQLYGLYVEEGELDAPLVTGGSVLGLREGNLQQDDADSPLVSGGSVVALSLSKTVDYTTYDWTQDDADSPLVTGGSVVTLTMEQTTKYSTYDWPQDDTDSPIVTGGSVQALNMEVTTGYQTYDWPQVDEDSPTVTGGSVINLTMTSA